jgi:L-cysteine/cystine lyase
MTQSRGVLEATTVHLDWLREQIGWPWIFERTQKLAALAREVLAGVPELTVITPAAHAGLVTVETDPVRNAEIAIRLKRRRIALRTWPELGRYRLSTAFFNTDKEINAVARALQPR